MRITSLAHVCLKTTDLARTEDFYCGALGLKRAFDFTRRGERIGFYLQAENRTFIEVFLADAVDPIERQAINHLCLETDDIAALHAVLTTRGLQPGEITWGADLTRQFWMKDPNGMAIEFQQYGIDSAQLTGQPVEVDW